MLNFKGTRRLPVILQAETAECGLACFAMINRYHGRHDDLVSLRQRHGVDPRGATLAGLMELAAGNGMTGRALRCEVSDLRKVRVPAVLHWDFNHFVVLKKAEAGGFTIHDPASGARHCSNEEGSRHFTGVVLELLPDPTFVTGTARRKTPGVSHYLRDTRGLLPLLAQLLVLSAIIQGVALASPFYLQLVVDQVLVKHDTDLLKLLAAGFLGISLVAIVTRGLRGFANIYLSHQLAFKMGTGLFQHLLHLPATFFARRHMGDIVSRFGSLRPIQEFITGSAINVALDGVMAATTFVMVFLYSPLLAGILTAAILLHLTAQVSFYVAIKSRTHESIAADASVDSNFMESIRSISAIKRFSAEHLRESDWQNRFADAINARIRVDRLGVGLELLDNGIAGLTHVLVVFLGARQVLENQMTVGMLYAFLSYRNHLNHAASSLITELMKFLMLSLHMERLADIQLAEPEQPETAIPVKGDLALRRVAFRYSPGDPWIIKDCSVSLVKGESLAVFGPSGCGKSTLLALMQNQLPMEQGQLVLDQRPLANTGCSSLRAASASVMQEDVLLAGSIRSNITFDDPFPDFQRVREASRSACIHDEILALPMGYETLVGEMGSFLSAGQQQRILIARALYRQPSLLFLDEGTAHLDRRTELRVMKQILSLGATCVFTTHSEHLLSLATQVMYYDNGGWTIRATQRPGLALQHQNT